VVLGKKSRKLSVWQKLLDLNWGELKPDQVQAVLSRIKQMGIAKRGLIPHEEFKALVTRARAGKSWENDKRRRLADQEIGGKFNGFPRKVRPTFFLTFFLK
jgi:hypothetical protein